MAFVELVEDHRAHAVQARVVLDHPGQDAFGDHLDAGPRRDLMVKADAVADRLPDPFAALRRHESRRGTRRHPARLQHDDAAPLQPGRIQQRQRHPRGLAGTRRRFQHQPRVLGEAVADLRHQNIDGEFGGTHLDTRISMAR